MKTTPPRSGLTWKPMGRIFIQVGLRWIPIREPVETSYNTNDSASPLRKETNNPNIVICPNTSSLSAGTSKGSEPMSSHGSSNGNILSSTSLNKMGEADINTLTMEQYLALTRGNQAPGMVKPEIRGNVNFEIKSQFIRELREDTFSGNKNDDAYTHVERILDIISLFKIPRVIHDAVMLCVFPITLLELQRDGWTYYL
uniref:Reverse transcriptase domain-containing protein n=1 Tax=Tanacetum cinerariifolium TaxID=118510 RepID=A0A6L2NLE5_TANCI|nr:hypothetical protein [Tanacetum cinerariifolium]